MTATLLIGYGPFRLDQLRPCEEFVSSDVIVRKVCREQPTRQLASGKRELLRPNHIQIWVLYGTNNAHKIFLHRSAAVFALTQEQARRISRRTARRKQRAIKKGSSS